MAITLGAMTKPLTASAAGYKNNGMLAPLQGQDLQDMLAYQNSGSYGAGAAGLQSKLGDQFQNYVNMYGAGGTQYNPQATSNANINTPLWAQKIYQQNGMNPQQAAAAQGNAGVTATSWSAPQVNGGATPPPVNAGTNPPPPPTSLGGGIGTPPPPTATGATGATGNGAVDWSKLDISKFMQPNVDFLIGQGTNAIQNSAAARGGLLSGNTLKGISDYAQNTAQSAYGAAQNAAFNDRNFMRGTYTNDRDYSTALDEWNKNFAQNQFQFNTGQNNYQQNFTQNQNQYDQNFAYNAQNNDRNFNYNSLRDLAQMGQYGTSGNAGLMEQLARLLSANTIASGQAGASGSIGGSNSINQLISQLLSQYNGNSFLSQLGLGGGT